MSTIANIIEGMQIVSKYCGVYDVGAEHDELFLGNDEIRSKMTEAEQTRMIELGWSWSKDADRYRMFV